MKRIVLALALLWPGLALAQNPTCPTRPPGTTGNACASVDFVAAAVAGVSISLPTNQILLGNGGVATAVPLTQDCSIVFSAGNGVITCTKTNNVAFTSSATGNAAGLTSGTLSASVMPALTGDVTSSAGSVSTTIANNAVSNAKLATATQNTVKGAATSTAEADLSVPSCSTGSSALTWTTNTGFGCNSIAGGSGTLVSVVTYSGTQTITIPAGATKAFIRMWGGTGGSGGIGGSGTGPTGGTGAAGYLEKYLTGLTPANTLAYTQGAAGAAGANTGTAGGNGTASTLASGTQTITTLTANGSNGSAGDNVGATTAGTAGGTATNGDVNITGSAGQTIIALAQSVIIPGMSLFSSGAYGVNGATSTGKAGNTGGLVIFWFT